MQRINLYQDALRPHRDHFDARRLGLLLIALALTLAAISGYYGWHHRGIEARLDALEAEREAAADRVASLQQQLQRRPDGDIRRQRLRAQLTAKRALLAYLDDGPSADNAGFARYLAALADRVVEGVWLSRVHLASGGARLQFDGHAVDARRIPALIASLGESPAYAGRNFRRLAIDRPAKADWRVDFTLASGPAQGRSE